MRKFGKRSGANLGEGGVMEAWTIQRVQNKSSVLEKKSNDGARIEVWGRNEKWIEEGFV